MGLLLKSLNYDAFGYPCLKSGRTLSTSRAGKKYIELSDMDSECAPVNMNQGSTDEYVGCDYGEKSP